MFTRACVNPLPRERRACGRMGFARAKGGRLKKSKGVWFGTRKTITIACAEVLGKRICLEVWC